MADYSNEMNPSNLFIDGYEVIKGMHPSKKIRSSIHVPGDKYGPLRGWYMDGPSSNQEVFIEDIAYTIPELDLVLYWPEYVTEASVRGWEYYDTGPRIRVERVDGKRRFTKKQWEWLNSRGVPEGAGVDEKTGVYRSDYRTAGYAYMDLTPEDIESLQISIEPTPDIDLLEMARPDLVKSLRAEGIIATRNAPRKKKAAAKYERYAYIMVFRRFETNQAENGRRASPSYKIFETEADLREYLMKNYKEDAFELSWLNPDVDATDEEDEAWWEKISATPESYYNALDKYLEEPLQWPVQTWNGKVIYLLVIPLEHGQGIEVRIPPSRQISAGKNQEIDLDIAGPSSYDREEIDHEKYYMTLGEFFSKSNPAPAAVYKVAKTGADLDVDKLITMPEKKAIALIEEKFGKGSRKAKAMTAFFKMKVKAVEGTGNLLRKMPVSNPKSKPLSVTLKKSDNPEKKLMAVFEMNNGEKIIRHFGAAGMSDYTQHKDKERMERYLKRHGGGKVRSTKEHWNDPLTAGALSRWILWNKPDLKASFDDFLKRFKLKGELKTKTSVKRAPKRNPKVKKKAKSMPPFPTIGGSQLIPFDDIKKHHEYAWNYGPEATRSFIVEELNLLMTVLNGPPKSGMIKDKSVAVFQRPETMKPGSSQIYKMKKKQKDWLVENFSEYFTPSTHIVDGVEHEWGPKTLQEKLDRYGDKTASLDIGDENTNEIAKWIKAHPKNTRNPKVKKKAKSTTSGWWEEYDWKPGTLRSELVAEVDGLEIEWRHIAPDYTSALMIDIPRGDRQATKAAERHAEKISQGAQANMVYRDYSHEYHLVPESLGPGVEEYPGPWDWKANNLAWWEAATNAGADIDFDYFGISPQGIETFEGHEGKLQYPLRNPAYDINGPAEDDWSRKVKNALVGFETKTAGKLSLDTETRQESWGIFFKPQYRERLDHYGNDGDGWDDAWYYDYATPLEKEVKDRMLSKGFARVDVNVGEKGGITVFREGTARKNPVEMVGSQPVDVTENFNTVIYRKSRLFDKDKKGNRILRYPKNMQKAAVTITGQENAKVRAGLINGKWAIQAVLIPRKPGLTRVNAVKLADKVMKRLAPKSKPSKLRMNPAFGKEADWQDDVDWDAPPASPEDWGKDVEWDDVERNAKVRKKTAVAKEDDSAILQYQAIQALKEKAISKSPASKRPGQPDSLLDPASGVKDSIEYILPYKGGKKIALRVKEKNNEILAMAMRIFNKNDEVKEGGYAGRRTNKWREITNHFGIGLDVFPEWKWTGTNRFTAQYEGWLITPYSYKGIIGGESVPIITWIAGKQKPAYYTGDVFEDKLANYEKQPQEIKDSIIAGKDFDLDRFN